MKNSTRRFMASIMAGVIMVSAGSALAVTAGSTPASAASVTSQIPSEVSDGFFSGASTLISVVSKSHPVAAIISSGLLGAFKTFYSDATKTPQPTNQDIVNLLNELSDKIDSHYNDQSSQVKALENIEKLQNFSNILTSVKGYNEKAMGQISLYNEDDICAQDYQNVIDCTVGKDKFLNDFMDLSNLIIDGQAGVKGKPSFNQYLEFSKVSDANNNDAALVKKDCENFNKMTLEQYTLFFTNLITGSLAKYNLAEYNYKNGVIDLKTKNSLQSSVKKDMELYFKKAGEVVKKYNETKDTLKNLTVAKVTLNGKTTEMFSFGDAWVYASKNNGTMQLVQDWKSDDLPSDVFYYKANSEFKNGALYVNGHNVTLDLNGHSIVHNNAKKYDLYSDNGTLTLTDSTNNRGAVNGIYASGGKVNVNGVTIKESADAGIRADQLKMDIKNTTFTKNKNSAVVTEKNAYTTIDNCIFNNNNESAVYNKNSSVTLKNSRFENNCSDSGNGSSKKGGAVYNHNVLSVDNCSFDNNKANKGGAIFSDYSFNVSNSTFNGNTANGKGGAIMFDYRGSDFCERLNLTNSRFTGNKAGNDGGGVFVDSMNYLTMKDVEIRNNAAGSNGGGLYCQKGSCSSCDPSISGKITIIDNKLTNGTKSNAFLGENSTSKCIFKISDNIDPSSRIGVTSPTSDKDLDICKIFNKSAYNNTSNVFSYDTGKYRINRYTHWYSEFWWVEIVKN